MKKLISAATSLCMAASMVGYVAPAVVGAADATKGFAIKTYDINNPSSASGKSTITLDKTKDFADGDVVIPCAVYYSEATDNSTGSLLVSLTTDSKDIKMKLHDPTMEYTADELGYTLGGVSFETNCYISFAGYCKNKRTGYLPAGKYVFGEAESQPAANTNNYFIGCSWMNNGEDYHWAGESSDSYPFYVFDVKIPKTIDAGSYKITYCRYNTDATGVNDNPAPMVESGGERYTAEAGNLKLEELTINVKDGDTPITTTSTTTQKTTTSATTTKEVTATTTKVTSTDVPVVKKDVNFTFVDENGNSTVELPSGKGGTIAVDVNIEAGTNPISALDVQFKTTPGIKISEIYKSTKAFSGVSVSSNLAELRASYATLNGDEAMTAKNGKSAFMLDVDVPADTPDGIYYVDFADQCKIFKDNTSFNYDTSSQPLKIVVGKPTPTQTSATTTAKPTGTTVTTKAPVLDGDINFEFVDENGNDTVKVKKGEATTIAVDVNINAGTNPISALDVQFKTTPGVKISEIYKSTKAFSGVSVSSNLAELRASYATLNGDEAMTAKNGKSAFMLDVDVPADTPEGIYYVDFADQCKIFKDNTSFNYKTASKPLKIVVGDPTPTQTSATTTAKPTGTTVTTKAPVLDGDINFKFVDENGESTVEVDPTKGATIAVDVNIEAGTNPISALDVQFKTSDGIKISEIYKSTKAFSGVSVSSNIAELRASYATLNGDEAMTAKNGKSAFMLDVDVPAGTPEGTYTVGFDSQCKIFKDNTSFNYKTDFTPLTIVVKKPGSGSSTTATATTTAKPTGTTVTTKAPVLDGDVNFKFVDENGESTVKVKKGEAKTIAVDVNIEAGTNPISALDVQFKTSDGVKISEIYKSSKAFTGVSVSSNIAELRASYATLNGDEAMTAKNGKAAFMLDVDVPATLAAGTYTVGFDSQCKIFKDNTSFNYKTAFTPLTIIVEDPTITTTTEKTTTSTSTTTTETTTKKTTTTVSETTTSTATTTTTTPQPQEKLDVTMWGDTNCDGVVNVADVVVLNRLLNEPTYVVKHPTTKADVTAQGKVNADVVDPQNKEGKGIDPTKVKLTGADSEAIAMYILEKGNIPQ